jgi:dihydrofolate reductase
MMKMSMTIDGFVASSNGRMDWMFKSSSEDSRDWVVQLCSEAGLHIMGSKTFNDMAAYWPTDKSPFAAPMNEIPKAVFTQKGMKGFDPSKTTNALENARQDDAARGATTIAPPPAAISWAEARIFKGDLAEGIRQLKNENGKPILAHGGAGFMRSLIATGLIDEYHLAIHPAAIGSGLPIFTNLTNPLELKLVNFKAFSGGVVIHTYQPV